jgi:hypothetical protein
VRVEILPSSGLRVAPIEPQQVPPLGRRQVRVSAEVIRSGQFSVQAAVHTPNGELLGPPSRLRVRSTAYGTITVWLTASAGILLVVLAAHRVVRRIRGEPENPSAAPPPPGPPEPRTEPHPTDRSAQAGLATPSGTQPNGPADPRHRGDPFPDPLATTDKLPVVRHRPDGPPPGSPAGPPHMQNP